MTSPAVSPQFDPGPLLSTHGRSRSFLLAWCLLALLFAAAGAFVLSLIPRVQSGSLRFSGPLSLLYGTGLGGLALGALVAGGAWLAVASQPVFHLHRHGLRVMARGQEYRMLYKDLQDLFLWYGGLALRAHPAAPWLFAAGRTQGIREMGPRLRALHAEHRVPQLVHELEQGRPAVFRALPDHVAVAKNRVADRDMNHPMRNLVVTRETLTVDDQIIRLPDIDDFKSNAWLQKSAFVDQKGAALVPIHINAILSLDVMLALIQALKSPAAQPAAAGPHSANKAGR